MSSERVTFVVDPDTDRDIIRWLQAQSNKSAAIRGAIRAAMRERKPVTVEELQRVLRSELASVTIASDDGDTDTDKGRTGDVDPEAGALLDNMF
jgi:hypothetical protein